jgi:hypothetical protein
LIPVKNSDDIKVFLSAHPEGPTAPQGFADEHASPEIRVKGPIVEFWSNLYVGLL